MTSARIRDVLARIASRPAAEWSQRIAKELPDDPAMRAQALLWLHADRTAPELDGSPPSLGGAADERYELTLRLDTGATASVWQAFDRRLGRNVAIKVFHEPGESEVLEQVVAEARAASDVVSEHVVRVLDVQYGDGRPYIVMELVSEYDPDKGEVVLGTAASASRASNLDEVVRWVMHVARGVHEAHLRNVFHRDLKPKNVLVTPNSRRARVADFGLAVSGTSVDTAHPSITLLRGGPSGPLSVRGTPEYMAPEQARGLPLTLDPRAAEDRAVLVAIDIWGLGAVAYELLTGRPPWLARPADDLSAWEIAASSERPPPLRETADGARIPIRLRRVIEKAMALDPKARYASAAALANELQAFLAKRPTTLDRSRMLHVALWCRRNPQLAVTIALVIGLGALTAGAHLTVSRLRDERDGLDREVEVQQAEESKLRARVLRSRNELEATRRKLAVEHENLANLEKLLEDERASYQTVLDAKEQALRDANKATRQIVDQLEAMRQERKATEQARAALEKVLGEVRRDADKAAKERDRIRREREAARAERDAVQRERDTAISEREAIEKRLRALEAELARFHAGSARARTPRSR